MILPAFLYLLMNISLLEPSEGDEIAQTFFRAPLTRSQYVQLLQQSISKLRKQNMELSQENSVLKNYREKYNQLLPQLDQLEEANLNLTQKNKNLTEQTEANQKTIQNLWFERDRLQNELKNCQNQAQPEEVSVPAQNAAVENLTQDRDRLKRELQKALDDLFQCRELSTAQEREKSKLPNCRKEQDQIDWLNDQIQLKNRKIADLNKKVGDLSGQNYSLNVAAKVLNQQLTEKDKKLEMNEKAQQQSLLERHELQETVSSLQAEIEKLKKKL